MQHVETVRYWTIDEHPDPDKCFREIRENWHDLGEMDLELMGESLRALSDRIGCNIDYSISIIPDRGEYVRADTDRYDHTVFLSLYQQREELPLTGTCYDITVLEGFNYGRESLEHDVLRALHAQGEWLYSDDHLREMCEANQYLFDRNGRFL